MLEASRFLIREQARPLQPHLSYDIYDGDTGECLGHAEEVLSAWDRFFRWFVSKRLRNTLIEIREEPDQALVFTIICGSYLLRPRVEVLDAMGSPVGYFQQKLFGYGFWIYNPDDQPLAKLQGNILGYDYTMTLPDAEVELGRVSKQWKGFLREMFSYKDTYAVELAPDLDGQPLMKMLLLAAALVTDLIYNTR